MNKDCIENLIGRSVLTAYGNFKTYKIEGIDYKQNPNSFFIKEGKQITYK
jgi:hypothetical protein